MNQNTANNLNSNQVYYQIARGVAIVAAVFSIILSLLLIVNYFQTRSIDPLNSPALHSLLQQLDQNPNNTDLREEIRALDLLARKAYFTSVWQIRTGGYLLLCGIIVLLAALKIMQHLRKQLPAPKTAAPKADRWISNILARRIIIISGSILVSFSLIAGVLSHSELQNKDVFNNVPKPLNYEELALHWPNFRGPGGNAHASFTDVPFTWNVETGENILWKVQVPLPGYSSPVVINERVFLTGGNQKERVVYCYQASDGKLLWQKPVPPLPGAPAEVEVDEGTGYAAPTPATDGRYLFAIFATGDLVCFDFNGNLVWGRNLGLPNNHYGHSSSLIVKDNLLFVQYDQNQDAKLFALETTTGRTVWEAPRNAISWSSPICVNTGKRFELILTNSRSVDAYDPATGTKLWGIDCLSGEVGPSAAYADGMVFAGNEYANGVGIKIDESGQASVAWEHDEYLPNTSSPVATEKYMFFATSDGYLVCLDAKTGEIIWEQEFDHGFYASAIVAGETGFLMDLKGKMHIFKLADTYESLGDPSINEGSACTPAILDGRIYIRGDKHLFCIGSK